MPRMTASPKDSNFNFRVASDLKAAFKEATEAADRPAAQVLRDFMRAYVEQRQVGSEPDYDDWFRAQVQSAIDDPRPSVPNDAVLARTRAIIDRIAVEKTSR